MLLRLADPFLDIGKPWQWAGYYAQSELVAVACPAGSVAALGWNESPRALVPEGPVGRCTLRRCWRLTDPFLDTGQLLAIGRVLCAE